MKTPLSRCQTRAGIGPQGGTFARLYLLSRQGTWGIGDRERQSCTPLVGFIPDETVRDSQKDGAITCRAELLANRTRRGDRIRRKVPCANTFSETVRSWGKAVDNFLHLENRKTGEILRMRRVRDSAGQIILKLEGSLPPRADGPPLHVHFREREEGIVQKGTLGARIGKQKTVVQSGGSIVLPAGVVHNWWNAGDDTLVFNGQAIPAVDLDRYLQAIFAILNANPSGRPSIFYLAHVSWRHRHTQALAIPPRSIQRIVFPLIVFVGHVLGKYRGDNWPGAPASCTGAPEV